MESNSKRLKWIGAVLFVSLLGAGSLSFGATACNDGIDNDGDGLVDWQNDLGCAGPNDTTENASATTDGGWSTFDLPSGSKIIYVSSSSGNDSNNGLSPSKPVKTITKGASLLRSGSSDFLLLKRGDTFKDQVLKTPKSGYSRTNPIVISSYGSSTSRPIIKTPGFFIDDQGKSVKNLAVIGLDIIAYKKDPSESAFDGANGNAFRFVSLYSGNILLEDNKMTYAETVLQKGTDFRFRRNVIYRSYHVNTCNNTNEGSSTFRPQGLFAGGVKTLVIEENVFDENGWNPDVKTACATIYNHNMYISSSNNVTIRDNLILRASSIGIKMASNLTGQSNGITITGNVIAEGEIGIGIGGNGNAKHRFSNVNVSNNVLTDIGRATPTNRTLSWYIQISDNNTANYTSNLLINKPSFLGNGFGFNLTGGSNRNVTIASNTIYGIGKKSINVGKPTSLWTGVAIKSNKFVTDDTVSCLAQYAAKSSGVRFSTNQYRSGASESKAFCLGSSSMNLASWKSKVESDAKFSTYAPADPGRNIDTYASYLRIGNTLDRFASEARLQSKFNYRPIYTAKALRTYLQGGH